MLPKELRNLLLIAAAKVRIAVALLLCAAVLGLWLFTRAQDELQRIDTGGIATDVMAQRRVQADSLERASLRKRFGVPVDLREGSKLFRWHCSACHRLDKDMTGPAMSNFFRHEPKRSIEWLVAFITNEDSLVRVNDPYTMSIKHAWGDQPYMHRGDGMSRNDVLNLIAWLEDPVHSEVVP